MHTNTARALTHGPREGLFPWVQRLAVTRMSMCLLMRVAGAVVRAFKRRRGARNVIGTRPGESRWGSYDTHGPRAIMHHNDYGRAIFYRQFSPARRLSRYSTFKPSEIPRNSQPLLTQINAHPYLVYVARKQVISSCGGRGSSKVFL